MAQVHRVDGRCPVCGGGMVVTRLDCVQCGSALEGAFALIPQTTASAGSAVPGASRNEEQFGRLSRLDRPQLEFVETFLRCRGVIKNVEDMLGISYPTVKARLASVLEAMGVAGEDDAPTAGWRRARRDILADLAAGRISTGEAHRLLAQFQSTSGDPEDREP